MGFNASLCQSIPNEVVPQTTEVVEQSRKHRSSPLLPNRRRTKADKTKSTEPSESEADGFISVRFWMSLNEFTDEDCILKYDGDIVESREDDSGDWQEVRIGHIEAFVVLRDRAAETGADLFGALDSEAEEEMMIAVFDPDDWTEWSPDVQAMYGDIFERDLLIIHTIEIQPEYRGRGVGYAVVRWVIDALGHGCGLVALTPFPLQWTGRFHEDPEAAARDQAKIRKYWSGLGFRQVGNSDVYAYCPELKKQPPMRRHRRRSA